MAKISSLKRQKFLTELAMTGRVVHSCKVAGFKRQTLYQAYDEDADFKREAAEAKHRGQTDPLEDSFIEGVHLDYQEVTQKFESVKDDNGKTKMVLVERRVKTKPIDRALQLRALQTIHKDWKPSQHVEIDGRQMVVSLPPPTITDDGELADLLDDKSG